MPELSEWKIAQSFEVSKKPTANKNEDSILLDNKSIYPMYTVKLSERLDILSN
jgi:hypothetical protein